MIPNNAQARMMNKQGSPRGGEDRAVDPSAGLVPYELKTVTIWDFNGPAGPQQFMIETDEGDFVKEEKDRWKIRCRQDGIVMNLNLYKGNLYFDCNYITEVRIRVTAKPLTEFTPTKKTR
jgi:hypothetical protein